VGVVEFYLADFRSADAGQDYVVQDWRTVDLKPLGDKVASLQFAMETTDLGDFGPNTPFYFALDDLNVRVGGRYPRDASYAELLFANMFQVGTDLATGDLSGDGITDGVDFNLWNAWDFVDPRQIRTMVPEPGGLRFALAWAVLCLCSCAHRRRPLHD
jgi:hypothetical protein